MHYPFHGPILAEKRLQAVNYYLEALSRAVRFFSFLFLSERYSSAFCMTFDLPQEKKKSNSEKVKLFLNEQTLLGETVQLRWFMWNCMQARYPEK